jgi:hypothetical protein
VIASAPAVTLARLGNCALPDALCRSVSVEPATINGDDYDRSKLTRASTGATVGTCKAGLLSTTAGPQADNGGPYLFEFSHGYVESRIKLPASQVSPLCSGRCRLIQTLVNQLEVDSIRCISGKPRTVGIGLAFADRPRPTED